MNWFKSIFSGIIAWGLPFILTEILFSEIPDSFAYVLYLLSAEIFITLFITSISIGYLRKRMKITVGIGFVMGIIWLITSYILASIYYVAILDMQLLDFTLQKAPVFLLYPIVTVFHGYCEERRGYRR